MRLAMRVWLQVALEVLGAGWGLEGEKSRRGVRVGTRRKGGGHQKEGGVSVRGKLRKTAD